MKLKVVIHQAEEGGYWAEVPAIPGCATQGETFEELLTNLYEAVEACLSVDITKTEISDTDKILKITVCPAEVQGGIESAVLSCYSKCSRHVGLRRADQVYATSHAR